jgi:hypothetical protein
MKIVQFKHFLHNYVTAPFKKAYDLDCFLFFVVKYFLVLQEKLSNISVIPPFSCSSGLRGTGFLL